MCTKACLETCSRGTLGGKGGVNRAFESTLELALVKEEDECDPGLARPQLSVPSWDLEIEETALVLRRDKGISTWPSSGGGSGAITISRRVAWANLWTA